MRTFTKIAAAVAISASVFASSVVCAHSQTPSLYGGKDNLQEAISLMDSKSVVIEVGNLNSKPSSFDILVDDKVVDTTRVLHKYQRQQITVTLPTLEKKKPVTYIVCSKSKSTGAISTEVCSKFQLVRL